MWYYAVGDDQQGPISAGELKQLAKDGTLRPSTLVWKEGMADWVPASKIKGLLPKKKARSVEVYDDYEEDDYGSANPYAPPRRRSKSAGRGRSTSAGRARSNVSGKLTQLKIAGGIIIGMAAITLILAVIGLVAGP